MRVSSTFLSKGGSEMPTWLYFSLVESRPRITGVYNV
eukprot:jgi/Antlo1/664/1600